jgi:hypothetical protein
MRWYPGGERGFSGAYFDRNAGDAAYAVFASDGDGWSNAWESSNTAATLLVVIALVGAAAAVTLLVRPHLGRIAGLVAAGSGAFGLLIVALKSRDDPWVKEGGGTFDWGVGEGLTFAGCAALTIAFGGALAARSTSRARPSRPGF